MPATERYVRGRQTGVSPQELVAAYARWIAARVDMGFRPTMLTFMFNHIPGSTAAVQQQMYGVFERTFRKVLTRSHRRPERAQWHELPLWITCVDWPVYKRFKDHFVDIALNEGAHLHGIALDPPNSRLAREGKTLEQHIWDENQQLYFGTEPSLHRIQCQTIMDNPGYVTDYALKALKSGRSNIDDILVLPRARAEL